MAKPWSLYLYFIFSTLSTCAITSLQIVVQFDGSLRRPSDVGVPTFALGRMAACACTVSSTCTLVDNVCTHSPLVMGGKSLIATSTTTSGEVEYEGLLFALSTLSSFLSSQDSAFIVSIASITVLGDCKTVIDQMIGKSKSRKLDQFYQRAVAEVDAMIELFSDDIPLRTIHFQHISRSKNVICDSISTCIILDQEKKAFNDVCIGLLNFKNLANNSIDITKTLEKCFQYERSLVPLSKRPTLYRYMAEIAIATKDYSGLLEVGSRYETDVGILERQQVFKTRSNNQNCDSNKRNALLPGILKTEAITFQCLSMNELGRKKEAVRLHQKNRFLLNQNTLTVLKIEELLGIANELPTNAMKVLLQSGITEADEHLHDLETDWPLPVQQWYHEATRSTRWNENSEWIFVKKFPVRL